jgi:hypothetical protein
MAEKKDDTPITDIAKKDAHVPTKASPTQEQLAALLKENAGKLYVLNEGVDATIISQDEGWKRMRCGKLAVFVIVPVNNDKLQWIGVTTTQIFASSWHQYQTADLAAKFRWTNDNYDFMDEDDMVGKKVFRGKWLTAARVDITTEDAQPRLIEKQEVIGTVCAVSDGSVYVLMHEPPSDLGRWVDVAKPKVGETGTLHMQQN